MGGDVSYVLLTVTTACVWAAQAADWFVKVWPRLVTVTAAEELLCDLWLQV